MRIFKTLLFLTFLSYSLGQKKIEYAAIIYRHGDRTPVEPYPRDPYRNESLWPVKFGELTNLGKLQHYRLGHWIRERYSDLLSDKYDPSEIYIRSTDTDRTLMSAQVNLAGMYPPKGKDVWNNNLMWEPIPVHSSPQNEDNLLAMEKPCFAYDDELERVKNSKVYKNKLVKYKELLEYLSSNAGKKVADFFDILNIYSTLFIENENGFKLPSWTHSIYPDKMKEPACYSFTIGTSTALLARLRVGPLLKQITKQMLEVQNMKDNNVLKMSIYSAHDITVADVLNALKIFDVHCPPFTATILLELLHDKSVNGSQYSVRILYRNSTNIIEPIVLPIPNCGTVCDINEFIKLYNNLIAVDWDAECTKPNLLLIIVLTVLMTISGILILFTIVDLYNRHNTNYLQFYRVVNRHPDIKN